ncbi:MAG TPA: choice-of-anchor tandem repeat GloVer-containing protein [Verrucomicrobiae bacterium]
MKTLPTALVLGASCLAALGQGQVQFRNYSSTTTPTINAPVYLDGGIPGQFADSSCRAALIGGPTTATPASLDSAGTLPMLYNPTITTLTWVTFRDPPNAGYVNTANAARLVPGVDWGGTALVQMVGWKGNYNTWAEAFAAWQGGDLTVLIGFSEPLVLRLPTGPTDSYLTYLWGLKPFTIGGGCLGPYFMGFTVVPVSQTVNPGESVTFSAGAQACPYPVFQWYYNGSPIAGAIQSHYQIASAQPSDAGDYYAILSGAGWGLRTSPTATLAVRPYSLSFIQQPSSQTVAAGQAVDFRAVAGGAVPMFYQWFFNVTNAISAATNSILHLPAVYFPQSGTYEVVVSNAVGAITSSPALLTVLDPYISRQPNDLSLRAGQTAFLSVDAGGSPLLSCQWLKDGALLSDGGNLSGARTPVLTISNVLGADAGGYAAWVSNLYGAATSAVARVTVQDPFITSQPVGQRVNEGDDVVFSVQAGGTAPLAFQWLKDGVPLADELNVSGSHTATLTLKSVDSTDQGAYRVIVSNRFGMLSSADATLAVGPQVSFAVLHTFTGADGNEPSPNLFVSGSTLYGTTINGGSSGGGTVFRLNTDGSGFAVLKNFPVGTVEQGAFGGVVPSGGRLYGTTWGDGTPSGCGTVFALNTDGSGYSVLHQFTGGDGREPMGSLLVRDGMLFGTTYEGGTSYGTLFRMDTNGQSLTVLHNFTGNDGAYSHSGLVASGSTLYGTTASGGSSFSGLVFRMEVDGSGFAVLKEFGADGGWPSDKLVLSGPTLYGTTRYAGQGCGSVFKLNTDGTGFTVLKQFTTNDVGIDPWDGLVISGSTLYGSLLGGTVGIGAVYRVGTDDAGYTVLKTFSGGSDGARPYALVLSGDTLYGATQMGGALNHGVIFSMSVAGPSVLSPPVSQTAEAGTAVAFRARGRGGSSLTYQWLFNGTNLIGATSTNALLRLPAVQFADAGSYSVILSNVYGSVTSAPAMLSVISRVERRPVAALSLGGAIGQSLNLQITSALQPGPAWAPLDTVTLTNSGQLYVDVSPLSAERFYRSRQDESAGIVPSLAVHLIPAIKLTGAIGSSVRIDYINQVGPIDAWLPLATVTLTDTSQEYWDTSVIGQAPRLYRLVTLP